VVMVVPSQLCECRETKGLAANKIMAIEGAWKQKIYIILFCSEWLLTVSHQKASKGAAKWGSNKDSHNCRKVLQSNKYLKIRSFKLQAFS
jgi:hypothetical protein